jgi:L-ascorbate metabolism protein UlaG (beta-lactamase superfamily)
MMRNSYYSGPVSDHFDGVQFFVPGAASDKSRADLWRWRREGGRAVWPRQAPSPFQDQPPARSDAIRVTLIGHASFLIQVARINILVDPVWSDRAGPLGLLGPQRVNQPGVAFDDLPQVDVVLITHNHYDHLDMATLRRLWRGHRPRFVAPLGNDVIIRRAARKAEITALDWGGEIDLAPGIVTHLQPCRHWSARGLRDRRMALWGAFVLTTPVGTIYHVGDTGFGDGAHFTDIATRFGPPDLAILPIGAYEPRWFMHAHHMNPDEAVQGFQLCQARNAIGHHWGTFQLTNEAIEAPRQALAEALAASNIDRERFRALIPGEVWQA